VLSGCSGSSEMIGYCKRIRIWVRIRPIKLRSQTRSQAGNRQSFSAGLETNFPAPKNAESAGR